MKIKATITFLVITALFASCSTGKYAATEKVYKKKAKLFAKEYATSPVINQAIGKLPISVEKEWIASINFGMRKPNYVVIHHTAQDSLGQTIRTFHSEKAGVSAHYVVGRTGKVVQMVNDYYRAHHAGIGTTDPWTDAQINALTELLSYLKVKYNIPQANFIGHMDLAPTRKNDPSRFPWKTLADKGFGYWYDEYLETPPIDFNPKLALRIIGYDVKNLDAAIKAFKQHYIQSNANIAILKDNDLKILYSIYKKFL
jgi:N-acetylmuramoyl-L-alanine amidase